MQTSLSKNNRRISTFLSVLRRPLFAVCKALKWQKWRKCVFRLCIREAAGRNVAYAASRTTYNVRNEFALQCVYSNNFECGGGKALST